MSVRRQGQRPSKKLEKKVLRQQAEADGVFEVELLKTASIKQVGLHVEKPDNGGNLAILRISENGLVHNYNKRVEDSRKIKPGDNIIEVNGESRDKKKMLEIVSKEQILRFVLQRRLS